METHKLAGMCNVCGTSGSLGTQDEKKSSQLPNSWDIVITQKPNSSKPLNCI